MAKIEKPTPDYLTQGNLGIILSEIFSELTFIVDKSVPGSKNTRYRPDYRCESERVILEFDGDSHYCKANVILRDEEKDYDYKSLGYKIIRIPYFIQITTPVLLYAFGKEITFEQRYRNGFIDSKAVLPADFCEMGISKFKHDLERFEVHKQEILDSLKEKITTLGDIRRVLPSSLYYLVE